VIPRGAALLRSLLFRGAVVGTALRSSTKRGAGTWSLAAAAWAGPIGVHLWHPSKRPARQARLAHRSTSSATSTSIGQAQHGRRGDRGGTGPDDGVDQGVCGRPLLCRRQHVSAPADHEEPTSACGLNRQHASAESDSESQSDASDPRRRSLGVLTIRTSSSPRSPPRPSSPMSCASPWSTDSGR
jgi:hypothetical protein